MNYLLFVYYDDTVENSEEKTNDIGGQISDVMTSKEIKFMFGDKHAIFHFASDLSLSEMGELLNIISYEISGFEFFLTQKTKNNFSNFPEDNLNHLLSLRKTTKKKTPVAPPRLRTNDIKEGETFMDIADLIFNLKRQEVCNMTLDELLDKIIDQGTDSLTDLEKQKLDEYSKSLN
jgi:hypothetical protein